MKKFDTVGFASYKRRFTLFVTFCIFCAVAVNAQTFTIFPGTGNDPNVSAQGNDGQGIEVGIKFKVTQIGTISAIRFYKYSGQSNGTFVASLWSNGNATTPGTRLATATANLNGAGWTQITIPNTFVTPGNVYIASTFTATGYYPYTNNYFPTNADQNSPPFIIVANGTDPAGVGNGVYSLGAASTFPSVGGASRNYWVDIVFTTSFALPVTITDFSATTADNNVTLSWNTQREYYNRGFEIQRSNNGIDWYKLSFIEGVAQSDITRNYAYSDKGLAPGSYYYRLNQTDYDGKSTLSSVVRATVSGKGKISLFPSYPNPFSGSTTIRFDLPQMQRARLSVSDLIGREVKVLVDKVAEAGSHVVTFDAGSLKPQIYIVTLRTESGVLTEKISLR